MVICFEMTVAEEHSLRSQGGNHTSPVGLTCTCFDGLSLCVDCDCMKTQ